MPKRFCKSHGWLIYQHLTEVIQEIHRSGSFGRMPVFGYLGQVKIVIINRLRKESRCAVGVVDCDPDTGVLRHVGIRSTAQLGDIDSKRLERFVSKYLGKNSQQWNEGFVSNIVDPLNVMLQITPRSIVAKDVSFFKTGPNSAELK